MNDMRVDSSGNLLVKNGDFYVDDATEQHVIHILQAHRGAYKNAPALGVGIDRLKGGRLNNAVKREIKLQLKSEGFRVRKIHWDGENLDVQIK